MESIRKKMQAVLMLLLCAAVVAANAVDEDVGIRMSAEKTYAPVVLPTIPPAATAAEARAHDRVKLDLNAADAWMLTAIPGVGEKIAARVIAYREENGGFVDVRELMRVEGIGEKLYAVMAEYVEIR